MMTGKNEERRGSKRAFFTLEEGISAEVKLVGHEEEETTKVSLLSISIGGLSFLIPRHQLPEISLGNRLKITDIQTPYPLGTIDEIVGEIRYVIDYDKHAFIAIGVEFTDILQLHRKKIFEYVNDRLSRLGLNKS
jgi:c-di-GMP-binding flagellar brake protein YcgR